MSKKTKIGFDDDTLLGMLPPDEVEEIKKRKPRRSRSYAFDPDKVLEPAYTNPNVRRWHRRRDEIDEEIFQQAIAPLVAAGKDDLTTFAKALSSNEIGFSPRNYKWEFHDGVYRPGDEYLFMDEESEEYWGDTLGETDPLKIIPKALGVTSPEQINARLAGTAFPALLPKLSRVIIDKGRIGVSSDFLDGMGGFVNRSFYFKEGSNFSPHLEMSNLELPEHMIGHGYGLAIHASNNAWARDVGLDTSVVDIAMDVGSYVWPLIGYDNKTEAGKVLMTLSRKMAEQGEEVGVFDLRDEYGLDSLPKIARHPLGKESLLNHALIELSQPTSGNEYFQEIAELRAKDVMEGKR